MAAKISFTAPDVVRLLHLTRRQDLEELITAKVLAVAAYTRRGQPLFDAEAVRRAAARVLEREP
jgi:hypothetical protein